jgi:hypothetical protein
VLLYGRNPTTGGPARRALLPGCRGRELPARPQTEFLTFMQGKLDFLGHRAGSRDLIIPRWHIRDDFKASSRCRKRRT